VTPKGASAVSGRKLAVVFLDGDYRDPAWHRALAGRADIVLAADGGARFLLDIGVQPEVVVGDFDSLDTAAMSRLESEGVRFVRHPVRKDFTDGELAVDEALRLGAAEVVLAGGLGALDHTLGHLAILRRLAARDVPARMVAPHLSVAVFRAPASVKLAAAAGVRVSLIPLGEDATVTLAGLDYPLAREVLPADACLGVGNHVAEGGGAGIILHAGVVAMLVEADDAFSTPAAVHE
jgi:thiamine pyrophosphokinase